jgi:glycosyltransferase involved in cell wall biosynthesis
VSYASVSGAVTLHADMSAPPIRVLYLMHSGSPAGSAESLCVLLEHFPPGAVTATVLCPEGEIVPRLRETGATVRVIPGVSMFHSMQGVPLRGFRLLELGRTLWMMRHGGRIRAAIRETQPDVVHLNERGMLHAARIAHEACVPVVLHARSVAERGDNWVRRLSMRAIRRHVSCVVAIDESVRASLEGLSGVHVVYNPLDDRALTDSTSASMRPSAEGLVRVTYLTGLQVFKGIRDLLEAALLLRDRSDIVFQIAGSNSRPAAFHRSLRGRVLHRFGFAPDVERWVRQWISDRGLGVTVKLAGRVEPQAILAETDVLVFPSHLDGPGRSVFEAGARGIPAVVALQHRIEDVVTDGETGLIVPERDPPALAQAILRLADDAGLRRRLGQNARTRYRKQFAPQPVAGQMLGLYQALMRQTHPRDLGDRSRPASSETSSATRSST